MKLHARLTCSFAAALLAAAALRSRVTLRVTRTLGSARQIHEKARSSTLARRLL
jgi:hypothetical protein